MAEFTGKNFVSEETDFTVTGSAGSYSAGRNDAFPLPDGTGTTVTSGERIESIYPAAGLTGNIYFISKTIADPLTGTVETVPRMSAFSVFNPDLSKAGKKLRVTQNILTVDSQAKILVPRAVALSTGFMEYLFRGDMTVVTETLSYTGSTLNWKFHINNNKNEAMSGNFYLYYDAADGTRSQIATFNPGTISIAAGGQSTAYTIAMPSAITGATNTIMVFSGQLGTETIDPYLLT